MSQYNFVVEASAFEKGLGNIRRWSVDCPSQLKFKLYIPTVTLRELDFLQHRRKSFNARESLKFIDQLTTIPMLGRAANEHMEITMEFPEVLDSIDWNNVNINGIEAIDRLPRRLKNLLKSAVYKCSELENDDGLHWILLTEDQQIRDLAVQCNIPCCSIIDADGILSKELNDKSFQESQKFNKLVKKHGTSKQNPNGEDFVMTNFNKTMYASRGKGKLWSPS